MLNKKIYNKEYYDNNKEKIKEYRDKNKEYIKEKAKEYRLNNKEKRKEYYLKNRERLKEDYKNWTENNREKYLESRQKSQKKYAKRSPEKYILSRTKTQSKRKGFDFNLSLEDILIPEYCPYMNVKLTHPLDSNDNFYLPSVDRIDSTKGYVKNNIQIISYLANRMKNNATEEQLVQFAKGVLKLHAGIDIDKILTELEQLQQVQGLCKD